MHGWVALRMDILMSSAFRPRLSGEIGLNLFLCFFSLKNKLLLRNILVQGYGNILLYGLVVGFLPIYDLTGWAEI